MVSPTSREQRALTFRMGLSGLVLFLLCGLGVAGVASARLGLSWHRQPSAAASHGAASAAPAPAPAPLTGAPPEGAFHCDLGGEETKAQTDCHLAKAYVYGQLGPRKLHDAQCDPGCQWVCVNELWYRESRWSDLSLNASSEAYGIPQILPAVHGRPPGTEPGSWKGQVDWGMDYIAGRYRTPCKALAFWKGPKPSGQKQDHWY